jgi:hypothetical protein
MQSLPVPIKAGAVLSAAPSRFRMKTSEEDALRLMRA